VAERESDHPLLRPKRHLFGHPRPAGVLGTYFDRGVREWSAHVASIEAERMLEDGIREVSEGLNQGVDVFVEHLPSDGGNQR
jgi:hypothetical protein